MLSEIVSEQTITVDTPKGAEGWQDFYPDYLLFSDENKDWEQSKFWFQDSMHHPEVQLPFETILPEAIRVGLGQYNSRIFCLPNSYGVEQRISNGYVYFSPIKIKDQDLIDVRIPHFKERTQHYYDNWDSIYEEWKVKVEALITQISELEVPKLLELEPLSVVKENIGISSGYRLMSNYNKLIDSIFLAWQYHFEMLNVGYVAYLNFINYCKDKFPDIKDDEITSMIKGINSVLFRPDQELRKLACHASDLGLAEHFKSNKCYKDAFDKLSESNNGKQWLKEFKKSSQPWFNFSNGNGFYHHHGSWINDLQVPYVNILNYILDIESGKSLERRVDRLREQRSAMIAKYRSLLPESERLTFNKNLQLGHQVAEYLEDHNFYIENWLHTVFWNKCREFGDCLKQNGFISTVDDFFYLNRWEAGQAIYECVGTWASGGKPSGPHLFKDKIKKRKKIAKVLQNHEPVPTLGVTNEPITEALTVTLFGVKDSVIEQWSQFQNSEKMGEIKGTGASMGSVKGIARVINNQSDLIQLQAGEILVCKSTAPSWTSVFNRVKAVVTDIGGIMSHAAIVCREYEVPAVVGAPNATSRIKTGDVISVDGNTGIVRIESTK